MMMMMKPKFECENKDNGDGDGDGDGKELLRDIEELSKALYLDNTSFKPSTLSSVDNRSKSAEKARLSKSQLNSTPRFVSEDLLLGDKKLSSKWNWKKPLKALRHIGSQKFVCCFNLHVHSIDGLPLDFDGIGLCVQWKRKNIILQTCPSRVFQGATEFDETLTHRCSVYGSSTASGRSVKYDSKCFLIHTSVVGEPEHNIGKHHVDLTRLLPLSLEELWGDKNAGKWSTRFRLAGKALGASLNVSFSYQVMKDELIGFGSNNVNDLNRSSRDSVVGFGPSNSDIKLRQAGCFPCELQHNGSVLRSHSDDVVLSNEAMLIPGSGFSKSITFLYQKLDEENFSHSTWEDSEHLGPPESSQGSNLYESDETEFSFSEGVETLEGDSLELDLTGIQKVDLSAIEIINVDEIIKDDDMFVDKIKRCDSLDTVCSSCVNEKEMADNSKHKLSMSCVNLPCMKIEDLVPETSEFLDQEHYLSVKSNYKMAKKSHSLDDIIDSVASDFLKSLALESDSFRSSCDGDPLSPREQLLRQFEKEVLASGKFTFDFDEVEEELREDAIGLNCEDCAMDSGLSLISGAAEEGYARENQSLIERRKAKILEDLETDSLMQQWGLDERDFENSPKTWSGGFGSPIELSDEEPYILPSIGEELGSFVQTKSGGFLRSMCPSLFRNAKNCGNLIIHASNPVILPVKMGNDILEILQHMASDRVEKLYDFIFKLMPLQDITGKSIKHIVQNADTNKEAPGRQESWQHLLFEEFQCSYLTDKNKCLDSLSLEAIAPMTINKIESLLIEGLRIQSGMSNEEAPTLERHYGEINNDLDGLMGLSVKLDQWLRLDSGIIQGEHNLEQILKILKAHNSKITELENEGLKNAAEKAKIDCRKRRYFENNITVAYTIQHRDPLRNYEAVGVPMLVLSQVERVDINAMEKDDSDFVEDADIDEETPQSRFKIKEIHLAGVLAKGGNRQVWGSASQQQSALRWLLACGLCNSTVNHSSSKSKAIIVRPSSLFTNKLMNQDILWSISCVNSNMKNNNAYIRNPDIIFPK